MNFLQLCQAVARESGTISGSNQPASVVGQSGRLLKIVNWTADAWKLIQNHRNSWRWMRKEFTGTTTAGAGRYTAASWNITDFARWITDAQCSDYMPVSIYKQDSGVADEGVIAEIPWGLWRDKYGRGQQFNRRPTEYAISPAEEFCLGSIPDDTYVVRGEYYQRPQILANNEDVPNCPARFHDVIVWRAVLLLSEHDEAPFPVAAARMKYDELMEDLERDQLPRIIVGGGPIA